jgi:sugar phosphate isomerase/epimerase
VKCGLSLPINYLAGSPSSADDFLFQNHFKDPLIFLKALKKAGLTSVEINTIDSGTETNKAALATQRVLDSKLDVTIHGYLPPTNQKGKFSEILPPIASIAEILKNRNRSSIITFHSYKKQNDVLSRLVDTNADFVKNIIDIIHNEKLSLKIALEINRQKGFTDPSTTYDTLMTVWEKIGDPKMVGFCWDFGHSYWNASNNFIDCIPTEDFLSRVFHTHIHDVSTDGQTHWPLTEGNIPLNDFVSRLKARNYNGTYNMELYPERWHQVHDIQSGIFDSISILTAKL